MIVCNVHKPIHSYTRTFFKTTASEVTVPNTFLFLSACFIPSFILVYTTFHRFHITPQHPPHRFRQHLTPTAQPFNAVILGTILHNPITISIPQYWRECSDHFSDRSEDLIQIEYIEPQKHELALQAHSNRFMILKFNEYNSEATCISQTQLLCSPFLHFCSYF